MSAPEGWPAQVELSSSTEVREHIPRVTVTAKVEVSGEWVNPEVVAYAARQLATSLAGALKAAADEAPGGGE